MKGHRDYGKYYLGTSVHVIQWTDLWVDVGESKYQIPHLPTPFTLTKERKREGKKGGRGGQREGGWEEGRKETHLLTIPTERNSGHTPLHRCLQSLSPTSPAAPSVLPSCSAQAELFTPYWAPSARGHPCSLASGQGGFQTLSDILSVLPSWVSPVLLVKSHREPIIFHVGWDNCLHNALFCEII